MMEELISNYLIPALATIITGIASYIGFKLKATYEKYIDTKTKKEMVDSTVKYVEQMYKNIKADNNDKLNLARKKAFSWLQDKGIKIKSEELDLLIESAVNGLKKTK